MESIDACVFPLTFGHIEPCDFFYIGLLLMLCLGVMQYVKGMSHQINDVIYKGQLGTYQLSFSSCINTKLNVFCSTKKIQLEFKLIRNV